MRKGQKLSARQRKLALAALRQGTAVRWNQTEAERFWSKVDRRGPNDCWPWLASLQGQYGQFYWRGRPLKASRAAWILTNGSPGRLHVLHKCDNPLCVNPKHLFLGTHADNLKDMWSKGRARPWPQTRSRGEASPVAKLTERAVRKMRRERAAGATYIALAKRYGVDRMTIKAAVLRKTWRHVQ